MVGALPRRHASRGGRPAAAPPWPPRSAPGRARRWRQAGTPRRRPPAARSCATMRPRSQRVVCSNAGRLTGVVRGRAPSAAGPSPGLGTRDRAGLAETRPALAHQRLTGQASQAGATGAAERGAELHGRVRPGRRVVAGHQSVGFYLQLGGAQRPTGEPADDPPHVGVHGSHRLSEGQGCHGPGGVGADAGQRLQQLDVAGHAASVLADDDRGGSLEVHRTAVVAQPCPGPQHLRRRCLGQRPGRREALQEAGPGLIDARDLRLLGHDLSHQHGPRLAGRADTQRTGVRPDTSPGGPPGTRARRASRPDDVAVDVAGRTGRVRRSRGRTRFILPLDPLLRVQRSAHHRPPDCHAAQRCAGHPLAAGTGTGQSFHHRPSCAARLAIARATAPQPPGFIDRPRLRRPHPGRRSLVGATAVRRTQPHKWDTLPSVDVARGVLAQA